MPFGAEIKRLREAADLSVRELAELLCVKPERLHKWEEKDYNPRTDDKEAIEQCSGIELDKFSSLKELPIEEMKKRCAEMGKNNRRKAMKETSEEILKHLEGAAPDMRFNVLLALYEKERENNVFLREIIGRLLRGVNAGALEGLEDEIRKLRQ